MAYAGFDRADCPDLAIMARLWEETNLVWCGFYLRAPSQSAMTWRGKRASLVALGFGLAPIFVGQQVTGPGSYIVTPAQGTLDGRQACADMVAEGFPAGSWIYLDLENGPPFGATQSGYVQAWAASVEGGGFRAGVYCSFLFAGRISAILPGARVWVYHVASVAPHPVAGAAFPAPDPAASGFRGAAIWQHQDEARLTAYGDLACDLDASLFADPSAPDGVAAPVAPIAPVAPAVVGIAEIQAMLNARGARPALAVDNNFGPATRAAVAAFQQTHDLFIDGIPGPLTIAALKAV
jgi:hypothetical protein